jgi:hypothetical protein|uniref:Uncharacterized protein n=1 Tax=Hydrogenobacter sp. TaxID=2152829 RepID=A0A7C2ZKE4_9AQUI
MPRLAVEVVWLNKLASKADMEKETLILRQKILRVNIKIHHTPLILLFTTIFLNKDALEFLVKLFGIIK